MKNTHIGAGIVLIPVSLWCLLWLIPHNTVPPTSEFDLSPALVPSIAVGTCLVAAVIMLAQALRSDDDRAREMDEEFGDEATGIDGEVLRNAVWCALAAVGSWLLIEHVGFEPAMTVLLVVTMLYVGVRSPWTIGLTAVLMPIALSWAAWVFFTTEMPGFWR